VHKALFAQQHFFGFYIILIWHTTINRTNRSTLRLIMKSFAFGTFVRNDIIELVGYRNLGFFGINSFSVGQNYISL
jgi:hypothetical protein